MNRSISKLVLPAAVMLLAACASGSSGGGDSPIGNTDIITREEIDQSGGSRNAMDLIQSLRPQWLNVVGQLVILICNLTSFSVISLVVIKT